jgi:flagellar hook assembly protein FlgD
VTGVTERPVAWLPESIELSQNYPNPFNPVTVIHFNVAQVNNLRYNVSLKVYNMLGQLVATLVDETQNPGYKSLTFDASNLPSGMYIYKLSAGTFTQARKMVVVKWK